MLRIQLFGSFHAEANGEPLSHFPSRKARDLLAYLALHHDEPQSRERLAGVWWSECDEERARHSLNTALWRLQCVLRPATSGAGGRTYLHVTPQQISLNTTSGCWLDVAEFETRHRLAKQATTTEQQMALYAQATECYSGELLPDCYDDWAIEARDRLQYQYLEVLELLLAHHAARGEDALALGAATRILACDPLREPVHRQVINIHLAANQPGLALRQYRACEEVLARDLGVAPAPESRALLTRVVAILPTASRLTPHVDSPRDLKLAVAQLHEVAAWCEQTRAGLLEAASMLLELGKPLPAPTSR